MMIVVPALTHRQQGYEAHVLALDRSAIHHVAHASVVVREMADQPVSQNAGSNTRTDAPTNKCPAAQYEKNDRRRQLLEHPGAFEEAIERVIGDPAFQIQGWLPFQLQIAMNLPPEVSPEGLAVTQIAMAFR